MTPRRGVPFERSVLLPSLWSDPARVRPGYDPSLPRAVRLASVALHSAGGPLPGPLDANDLVWMERLGDPDAYRRFVHFVGAWHMARRLRACTGSMLLRDVSAIIGRDALLAVLRAGASSCDATPALDIDAVRVVGMARLMASLAPHAARCIAVRHGSENDGVRVARGHSRDPDGEAALERLWLVFNGASA
ncbi:hypothetical protein [Luteibacter sp. CQ10]|uniref:hypothetical protein n=1 Tax=Luteibacter sp. CQ10 TaxID=2805821 RepID=UPI0034A25CFC